MSVVKKYRRRIHRFEEWHFHPECSSWPEADYVEQDAPSRPEELCMECIELHRNAASKPDPDSRSKR